MSRAAARNAVLAVPLLLVNTVAVWGQAGWAYQHLMPSWVIAFGFAAAVESIGVYLAWEAHDALLSDQASGLLRLGSYGVGGLAGALNYAHFAGVSGRPTALAITFAALSSISPWLWAVRSRALNRARLAELGLVDVRCVRLSTARKVWHPVRSLRVVRWAAWAGVTSPALAVSGWERARGLAPTEPAAELARPDGPPTYVAPADMISDMSVDEPQCVQAVTTDPGGCPDTPGHDLVPAGPAGHDLGHPADITAEYPLVSDDELRTSTRTSPVTSEARRAAAQALRDRGLEPPQIAEQLGISPRHVRRLLGHDLGHDAVIRRSTGSARINGHGVLGGDQQ